MDAFLQRRRRNATAYFEEMMEKLQEVDRLYRTGAIENLKIYDDDLYFNDVLRKIDYIFVYKKNIRKGPKDKVNTYLKNLHYEGFQFELADSELYPNLMFIKVYVPRTRQIFNAFASNYEPTFMRVPEAPMIETEVINFDFMYNDLTRPGQYSDVAQRASKSSLGGKIKELTTSERTMITYQILKRVKYGSERYEIGIDSLLDHNYLQAAYPLHDGTADWRDKGYLNDRQLLMKYWAQPYNIFKFQPLDLIYKYYGADLAFYFAFVGFYNRMLIPVAGLGLFSFLYGVLSLDGERNHIAQSICKSDEVFCPLCLNSKMCSFHLVKEHCWISKLSYIVDNEFSFLFAILMSFWATILQELWKRKEATLRYKWNLLNVEYDATPRPEFTAAMEQKFIFLGQFGSIPFTPITTKVFKILISCLCCGFLALLIILGVVAAMLMRLLILYSFNKSHSHYLDEGIILQNIEAISHLIENVTILVFILICDVFYKKIAKKLTDFENPRTEVEYEKSYIYKIFVFCWANNYSFIYYTAFFQGAFFTYPADPNQAQSVVGLLNYDARSTQGNIWPLTLQVIIFMTGKSLAKASWEISESYLRRKIKQRLAARRVAGRVKKRSWEAAYQAAELDPRTFTVDEYKSLIIQYGYLTMFPSAFPLAPLFALIWNVIEIRLDAYKMIKLYRRPVPRRVPGIGAWFHVLVIFSYIGIFTNSFLLAFTSQFTTYLQKYYLYGNENYLKSSYSKFDARDYPPQSGFTGGFNNTTECLYIGLRYPPDHPRKYEVTKDHYATLSLKLLTVITFHLMLFAFIKMIAFAIPDVPRGIRARIFLQRQRLLKKREKSVKPTFRGQQRSQTAEERRAEIARRLHLMLPQQHPG